MPPGVKEQLGLKDPKGPNSNPTTNAGSTEQADKFKAAFQAASAKINECLQYTAAHAEQAKHDPQAAKRDTSCQAYQVALGKIDPTNPSAAQGAIDQVLAGVQTLQSGTEAFKAAAEKAYNAWMDCQGEFDSITEQIRELLDWGDESAAPFQEARTKIQQRAFLKGFGDALQGVKVIGPKLTPRVKEMMRQKAAKQEYDPAFAALQPRLEKAKACTYKPLQDGRAELESSSAAMCELASTKDYVSALKQLSGLVCKVDEFEAKVAEYEAKKKEYEDARAQLEPKLAEASQCTFKSLAEMDQKITAAKDATDAAAAEENYVLAAALVKDLGCAVDEKLGRIVELEAKKAEYDTARGQLDPKLGEASQCQHEELADLDQNIADLTSQTDKAAEEEKYDEAVCLVSNLSAAVDEKIAMKADLEAYKAAREALDPKLADASQCQHEELADLDQKIADLTGKMDAAVASKDFKQALQVVGELSTAVDEKIAMKADIEAYKAAREALDPKLAEASQCQHEELADLDQKIADLTGKMDAAVASKDFKQALVAVGELSAAVDEKIAMQADLEAYKAAREALDPKLTEASQCQHEELADLDQKIADLTGKMDAAVAAKDFKQALQIVGELSAACDEKVAMKADLEAYKAARAAVDPKIQQAAYCSKHEELAPIEKEIEGLKTQLDQAVTAKDYKTATTLCGTLSAKIDTKLSEQGRLDRQIVGSAQKERAEKKLEALDEETRKRYNAVADAAKTPEERDYLSKALASGHSIDDIEAFAKKINGKDKDWLQNNLKLTGSTDGKGVKQQWKHSCNATTAQALKGELDPVYALKLHEENKDITDVDESDGDKINPKLAEEQKKMLESKYGDKSGGTAYDRNSTGKSGRWADDLENNMSDSTGVTYTNKRVDDGGTYKVDDAVKDVDAGLKKGHPVPLVVGTSNKNFQHYVLVTGKNPGPPETWTIHDPWDGVTVTRSVQDIKDGKLNVANCTRITGLDNPATKE